MTDALPGTIELGHVETRTSYTVTPTDEYVLRNGRRSLFRVEAVEIVYRNDRGVRWIGVKGRKIKDGRYTDYGFGIEAGLIKPDGQNPEIPRWLSDLLGWYQANHQPQPGRVRAVVPAGSDRFA